MTVPKITTYQETFAYDDMVDGGGTSGTFVLTHTIPAGARFLFCLSTNITGFTGDASAVITVGDGSDADRYNTGTPDVFVTAAAGVDMGVSSGTDFHATAVATVTATITAATDFSSVAAGSITLTLFYLEAE